MRPPRRKRIRLSPELYREPGRVFSVTIGTSPRTPVFSDRRFGRHCIDILRQVSEESETAVLAFCLMPDHVHLLVEVPAVLSLTAFVRRWKSRCFHYRRSTGDPRRFWQRSFYDHALRNQESLIGTVRYILENPVRQGLVRSWRDYPLCGSFELDL